jgi:outer membrane protein assembly factor BamB
VITSTGDTDSYLPLLAMTPGALYVQSITATGDTLTQLDPPSGAVRWRAPLPLLVGPMLVDGATLYAITSYIQRGGMTERTGSLVAYSASNGCALWSARLPSGASSGGMPLARVGGVVIAAYLGSALEAYGAQGDHHQVWSATIPGALIGLSAVE